MATKWQNKKSRAMKSKPTSAELVMLGRLEMSGLKFKHQHPLGIYLADFLVPKKLIVIEVDGEYHRTDKQMAKDIRRDKYMNTMGFTVVRVQNSEAASFDLESVHAWPDATPQEMGRAMGKAGSWGKAMNRERYKRKKLAARR